MTKKTYNVPDVSCEHCVAAVNRELRKIEGISDVDVDLDTKTVTVAMSDQVTDEQVIAGLDEAGYDVAPA